MSSFQERQKSLFNHLKEAEKQHNFSRENGDDSSQSDYGVMDRRSYRRIKGEMKHFRGRESIFKRPEAPLRHCLRRKTVPDYVKNPQKWVHYSLADVTQDQMSDATNTATALALLQELEEREANINMEQDIIESESEVFKKPTFHSSVTVKKQPNIEDNKITFKSSKVIMPEYVVGVSGKKNKKTSLVKKEMNKSANTVKKIELKLDHLYENDE